MCAVPVTQPAVAHYLNNTKPTKICNDHGGITLFSYPIQHTFSATDHTCISCARGHRILNPGLPLKAELSAIQSM